MSKPMMRRMSPELAAAVRRLVLDPLWPLRPVRGQLVKRPVKRPKPDVAHFAGLLHGTRDRDPDPARERHYILWDELRQRWWSAKKLAVGHPDRKALEAVGPLPPRMALDLLDYLPKLSKRGAPKGSGRIASNSALLAEMDAVAAGMRPAAKAARRVLVAHGQPTTKGAVDHLVRLWRERAK